MHEKFKEHVKRTAEAFRNIPKEETIRVISHYDCDGICSCAILLKALNRDNRKYCITILQQLDEAALNKLAEEDYKHYAFTDLGSGQYSSIKKILSEKGVFILDHHELQEKEIDDKHANPHFFDIDGSKEISGAGVVYYFAKAYNPENKDMAHIAIVGAIGDVQEDEGFLKLNDEILQDAVDIGNMEPIKEIKLYGRETRPIHKALEYSTNPFIPGVSGSESGAIQMLQSIGVNPKRGTGWKKYTDLNEGEKQKLASAIILRRLDEEKPEDIFGFSYILKKEQEATPFRDAKEFSTLLNACGRMNKASIGIGACLGIQTMKQKAMKVLAEYKKEIVHAMNWYDQNKKGESVITGEGYMIINAKNNIMSSIIGTTASIISKSGNIQEGTYIMSLARTEKNQTKVSLRVAGLREQNVDLREIVTEITSKTGGESGGHSYAAGAIIPTEIENEFLDYAKEVLEKKAVEEKVV